MPDLGTPAGVPNPHNAPFPGCVLRTTRGYRLPSLRDDHTSEAWEQVKPAFPVDLCVSAPLREIFTAWIRLSDSTHDRRENSVADFGRQLRL